MAEMDNRLLDEQEDKIDIITSLQKGWKIFKKTWWLLILLSAVSAALVLAYARYIYTPEYEAAASFAVGSANGVYSSDYTASISMAQLSATFPYVLESGALKDVVCEDLGLSSLPGTISVSVLEDTNLFQMRVKAGDAQMASDILESVIANYPTVARYIIGDTTLTMLDNTGVPTHPSNSLSMKLSIVKGILAAGIIYIVIVTILAAARKTVNSEEDLKKYTSVRCLAGIPKIYMKRRSARHQQLMLIDRKVDSGFVEAVNTLRIRVLRQLRKEREKVILVTSASEGEGKSTISANLALACAQKGYKTLIIDGDLRNPSVGDKFAISSETGIKAVLAGEADFKEAVVQYDNTSLDILPGERAVGFTRGLALLNSDVMRQLLLQCRESYDYIFIDTPPCGMMQDAVALARISDSALMVIKQDYIAQNRILDSMELITETGIKLLGYVINGEDTGIGSYGYGRYGYGRYGYGKYGKYGKEGYGERRPAAEEKTAD